MTLERGASIGLLFAAADALVNLCVTVAPAAGRTWEGIAGRSPGSWEGTYNRLHWQIFFFALAGLFFFFCSGCPL